MLWRSSAATPTQSRTAAAPKRQVAALKSLEAACRRASGRRSECRSCSAQDVEKPARRRLADCAEAWSDPRASSCGKRAPSNASEELKKRIEAVEAGQGTEQAVIEAADALPPRYGRKFRRAASSSGS